MSHSRRPVPYAAHARHTMARKAAASGEHSAARSAEHQRQRAPAPLQRQQGGQPERLARQERQLADRRPAAGCDTAKYQVPSGRLPR